MDKEDLLLISAAEDKLRQSREQYLVTSTNFLDEREQGILLDRFRKEDCLSVLFGGYDDSQRRALFFFPPYSKAETPGEAVEELRKGEECTFARLRFTKDRFSTAGHRDYLGALMGLGLRREMIGDIIVTDGGCDIFAMKSVKKFILENFTKAGRATLKGEEIPLSQQAQGSGKTETVRITAASMRLDVILAQVYRLSRASAAEGIDRGLVFVNDAQALKCDMRLSEGDKIVLRGKGKAIIEEVSGATKKGRIAMNIKKYI